MRARLMQRLPISTSLILAFGLSLGTGCTGAQREKDAGLGPELELIYDDGQAADRPLLPESGAEWLVKFDPGLAAYRPLRLRLLVADPGELHLSLYAADENGRPGSTLKTIDKQVEPEATSSGQDGKWLLVSLSEVPTQLGPLFLGISAKKPGEAAARLWVSGKSSTQVFQRDSEPATALQSTQRSFTPLVRLAVSPARPPVATPAAAGKPVATGVTPASASKDATGGGASAPANSVSSPATPPAATAAGASPTTKTPPSPAGQP